MAAAAAHNRSVSLVTDGEIAALNLESVRRRAWSRFTQDPQAPGVAEAIADMERLTLQFLGDVDALDRLETLASQFALADRSSRMPLLQAEVASTAHRFAEARDHLACATAIGAPAEDVERQLLAIEQACGVELGAVLDARRRTAGASGRLEDLVPLAALLADLERFAAADAVYRQALAAYDGTSPFPPAWAAFQLGMLWGELALEPNLDLAARWYRRALVCVPAYAKARVHLAEIHGGQGRAAQAEALLVPALSSGDPEVSWRLADVLHDQDRFEEARTHLKAARRGFEGLLSKHPLAFADHAAAFYAGSGNDLGRALELARTNAANRPTRRAVRQVDAIGAASRRSA
jgi:hypothetical protein